MKKVRKIISMALALMLILSIGAFSAQAAGEAGVIKVSMRIEGITEAMYFSEAITISDGASIAALLEKIKDDANAPQFVINESFYVSEIGGLAAGDYGGWSGWSFQINGKELTSGITENYLSDGDAVVCYYGDPWGEPGMQYPIADLSKLFTGGVISFTSMDTTVDPETWESEVSENPVAGAKVTFNGAVYTTNENGEIRIADLSGISGFRSSALCR